METDGNEKRQDKDEIITYFKGQMSGSKQQDFFSSDIPITHSYEKLDEFSLREEASNKKYESNNS